ncbi:MAG: biotin carboxylase [Acidobacteria bacterium]|nr:MAG: biotin carboxylase [Acidobacteriota bacterium]
MWRPGPLPHAPHKARKLESVSDIRRFFHRNEEPVFFISATNFNLLNIDEWVHRFRFINYIDCFDGKHPNVFVPSPQDHPPFQSLEDVNKYLLRHPEVREYIQSRGSSGKALFLFFDDEIEQLCEELGLEVCFPSAQLRTEIDNKINTTRIGNRARVQSVPNVLAKDVTSWSKLRKLAAEKLGTDLVLQTSFGDSGHTTFFVKKKKDFDEIKHELPADEEIKIMKRVDCVQAAVEACITRCGTLVGPLMTELVGFEEMTPYRGGWCGNEVFADAFNRRIRDQARRKTVALGKELAKEGYRGYFEVDYLIDRADGKVYLGEINPRITGASSMTNLAAFAQADAPLFLFHLLEWMGVDFEIDVEELNLRWSDPENIDSWSQMVLKHTDDDLRLVNHAPRSGVWGLGEDGSVEFLRPQTHRRTVEREWEGFFLRIASAGDLLYEGADLGILITPGRLMDEKGKLTDRARAWAQGIVGQYRTVAAGDDAVQHAPEIGRFKIY